MSNHVRYQQVQCFPLNLQGYPQQNNQPQIYTPPQNSVRSNASPTFTPYNIPQGFVQQNQIIEPSPSNRILSSTARVLHNQILDLKQKISQPQQQQQQNGIINSGNQNIPAQQGGQINLNQKIYQNGGIVMNQRISQSQKPSTPCSYTSSQTQQVNQIAQGGFREFQHNFQRSNSANINKSQKLVQKQDYPLAATNIIQYLTKEKVGESQNNNGMQSIPKPIQYQQNIQLVKQKQKCMTYTVPCNQPIEMARIVRRMSAPVEEQDEMNLRSTRYSEDFNINNYNNHKQSYSIQSTTTTTNKKDSEIFLISNYSPFQQTEIYPIQNTNQQFIDHPLELDQLNNPLIQNKIPNQNLKQEGEISEVNSNDQKNSNGIILNENNNNNNNNNCTTSLQNIDRKEENTNTSAISNQDSQSIISEKMINLYFQPDSNSKPKLESTSKEFNTLENEINHSNQIEEKVKKSKVEQQQQLNSVPNSQEQKKSKYSDIINGQVSTTTGNLSGQQSQGNHQNQQNLNKSPQSHQSIQSNSNQKSETIQENKLNQKNYFIDDKYLPLPYSPKQQYKEFMEANRLGTSKKGLGEESKQIQNQQKLSDIKKQNDLDSNEFYFPKNQISNKDAHPHIPAIPHISSTHSSKKQNINHHHNKDNHNQELNTNYTPRKVEDSNSRKSHQIISSNLSNSRQITFPESPISMISKNDQSVGFGSDTTYNDEIIQEQTKQLSQRGINGQILSQGNHGSSDFSSRHNNIKKSDQIIQKQHHVYLKHSNTTNPMKNKEEEAMRMENPFIKKHENKRYITQRTQEDRLKGDQNELDQELEANPDFINLYKTPMKPSNNSNLKELQVIKKQSSDKNEQQGFNGNPHQIFENQQITVENVQEQQSQKEQKFNIVISQIEKSENQTYPQNDDFKKQQIKQQERDLNQNNLNVNQQINIQVTPPNEKQNQIENEYQLPKEDQSPFLLEIKKQHEKIIEQFTQKSANLKLESLGELVMQKSQQSTSIDGKESNTKNVTKKVPRNEMESIQSIKDLLFCMGGLQTMSVFDNPPTSNTNIQKQLNSIVLDENSPSLSKHSSIKNINSEIQIEQQVQLIQPNTSKSPQKMEQKKEMIKQEQNSQQNKNKKKNSNQILTHAASQDKFKKPYSINRQDSPSKNPVKKQLSKVSSTENGQLKIQDLYTGQYHSNGQHSTNKLLQQQQSLHQNNLQQQYSSLSQQQQQQLPSQSTQIQQQQSQSNQQKQQNIQQGSLQKQNTYQKIDNLIQASQQAKQRVQERKMSVTKVENNENIGKKQNLLNQKKSNSGQSQLSLIIQIVGKQNEKQPPQNVQNNVQLRRHQSGVDKQNSKTSLQKQENASINLNSKKSSNYFSNSSLFQNNNSSSATSKLTNNQYKSVQSSQTNIGRLSECGGGSILVESIVKNNDDLAQTLYFSQNQQRNENKPIQNNSYLSTGSGEKKNIINKRTSFEGSHLENLEEEDQVNFQNENVDQINQMISKCKEENLSQPYIKLKQAVKPMIVNPIRVEDTYQGQGIKDIYHSPQDTDRSMKSDRQIKKDSLSTSQNKKIIEFKKQNSLYEKNEKAQRNGSDIIINLQKDEKQKDLMKRNTHQIQQISQKQRDSLESSPKSQGQKTDLFQFNEIKLGKKPQEQNLINLKQNSHYRRESYSSQKIQQAHELKERPNSIQKSTIHHSIDRSIQDLIEDRDRVINLGKDQKKKMLTTNSPILHSKSYKGYTNQIQQSLNSNNQGGSYSSNKCLKNQYYGASSKVNLQSQISETTQSFTQYPSPSKLNQKQQSAPYNQITTPQQMQKSKPIKKEEQVGSPLKLISFEKMK